MIAYHTLPAPDREWALDNSRRQFRVRPTRNEDRPGGVPQSTTCITIVRLVDGHRVVLAERCLKSPCDPDDNDNYARFRLDIINQSRRARGEAEV